MINESSCATTAAAKGKKASERQDEKKRENGGKSQKGPSINDVTHKRGEGGCPKRDLVREVAGN